jgi:ClpP class serine protease
MNHPRILKKVYNTPWGVTAETHEAIRRALAPVGTVEHASSYPNSFQRRNHFSAQKLGLNPPANRDSRVYRRGQLAFIPISGIIGKHLSLFESMCGGYDLDQLQADIDEVQADSMINNVLIDFDSPGGLLTGLPETADMLAGLSGRKQLFGFSETEVCSAAYWLYSQCEVRYATESSMVGAVGVYAYFLDYTKNLEMQGITPVLIRAGKFKGDGLPGYPLSKEETGMIQEQVDLLYGMMVDDIQVAHTIDMDALQGQVFIGSQALENNLVDVIRPSLGAVVDRLA